MDHQLLLDGNLFVDVDEVDPRITVDTLGTFTVEVLVERSTDGRIVGGAVTTAADYLGAIEIDIKNGSPGIVVGVNGTPGNPSDNLADATTLAGLLGFRKFALRNGNLTLIQAYDDWVFAGEGAEAGIKINGQDIADSLFLTCGISGVIGNGKIIAKDCVLDGVSNFLGEAFRSWFKGTTTFAAGVSALVECGSLVAGMNTPIFDAIGAGRELNVRSYSGGFELRNFTDVSNLASIEFVAGSIILGPTNTAVTVVVRGIADKFDTSGAGLTVIDDARVITSKISKILTNRTETDPVTGIMTVYDDDDVTPLFTATIFEDIAATQQYRSQGIDRRDRLS